MAPSEAGLEGSTAALARMRETAVRWGSADQRTVFLRCYELMTASMLEAIASGEFEDAAWVARLLDHFAEYYFDAADAYDRDAAAAPQVWRLAHDSCLDPDAAALQRLLLGINAHINYDLALALADLLGPEWGELPIEARRLRQRDYARVNEVIAATVDQVQDQVVEPLAPLLRILDVLLGGADELLASRLLDAWRDGAWAHSVALLEAQTADERADLLSSIEASALRTGRLILLRPADPDPSDASGWPALP